MIMTMILQTLPTVTLLIILIDLALHIVAYSWLDADTHPKSYDYTDRDACSNDDEVTVMLIKHTCLMFQTKHTKTMTSTMMCKTHTVWDVTKTKICGTTSF